MKRVKPSSVKPALRDWIICAASVICMCIIPMVFIFIFSGGTIESSAVIIDGKTPSVERESPTPQLLPPTPDIDANGEFKIILNLKSKTFHISENCSAAKRISDENRGELCGQNESDCITKAKAEGYKPCGVCSKKVD